jgi:amino acid permease
VVECVSFLLYSRYLCFIEYKVKLHQIHSEYHSADMENSFTPKSSKLCAGLFLNLTLFSLVHGSDISTGSASTLDRVVNAFQVYISYVTFMESIYPILLAAVALVLCVLTKFGSQSAAKFHHMGFKDSVVNLVRLIIGSAFLILPISTFKHGYKVGFTLMTLSAIASFGGLYFYEAALRLTIKEKDEGSARVLKTAKDLVQATRFSQVAYVHEIMTAIKAIGVGTTYTTLIADFFSAIRKYLIGPNENIQALLLFSAIVLMFVFQFMNVLHLDVIMCIFFTVWMYYMKRYLHLGSHEDGKSDPCQDASTKRPDPAPIQYYRDSIPFFSKNGTLEDDPQKNSVSSYIMDIIYTMKTYISQISLFVFAFTCHHNVFKIHNNAKTELLPYIHWVMFVGVGIAYVFYGLFSYFICESYHETLSVKPEAIYAFDVVPDGFWHMCGRLLFATFILIAYPSHANSFADSIVNLYNLIFVKRKSKRLKPSFARRLRWISLFSMISINILVALLHPSFAEVTKTVGSIFSGFICFILPPYYYIMSKRRGKTFIECGLASILLIFGVAIFTDGAASLYNQLRKPSTL